MCIDAIFWHVCTANFKVSVYHLNREDTGLRSDLSVQHTIPGPLNRQTHRQTDVPNYCNPRCACVPGLTTARDLVCMRICCGCTHVTMHWEIMAGVLLDPSPSDFAHVSWRDVFKEGGIYPRKEQRSQNASCSSTYLVCQTCLDRCSD